MGQFLSGVLGAPPDITYDGAGNITGIGKYPNSTPIREVLYDGVNMQTHFLQHDGSGGAQQHIAIYGPGDLRFVIYDASTQERQYRLRDPEGRVLREWAVNGWGHAATGNPGANFVHTEDFLYGADGLFATRARTGLQLFFAADHLGSTRAIIGRFAGVLGTHHYYPFGIEVPQRGNQADQEVAKFTGHERDPHGLSDYMRGRTYYYPLYRFGSVDPATDGWNLYSYVRNNPIGFTDPSGYVAADRARELQGALGTLKENAGFSASDGSGLGIVEATITGASFDLAIGFLDIFTVGAATGEALGSGASNLGVTKALAGDALRVGALVAPVAGAGRATATRVAARRASKALDGAVEALSSAPRSQQPAVVVGASSRRTGQTVVGRSKPGSSGCCAEVDAASRLGGNYADIQFSRPVRPRTGATIPVCRSCQEQFSKRQFPKRQFPAGTPFDGGS